MSESDEGFCPRCTRPVIAGRVNHLPPCRKVEREQRFNCAIHGQDMHDACICRGGRYWMERALAAEQTLEAVREAAVSDLLRLQDEARR